MLSFRKNFTNVFSDKWDGLENEDKINLVSTEIRLSVLFAHATLIMIAFSYPS